MKRNGIKIYLAAPLFSPTERRRNRELRDRLVNIGNVYLPQEDGSLIFDLIASGVAPDVAKQKIFESDIAAITACDLLIIVLDGRSVDEGAAFELGYAYALGKVCVGLKTDARTLAFFGDNPMIESSLTAQFSDEDELTCWLELFPKGLDPKQ